MRILITGANGFVGQAVSFHLCQAGHQVVATTRHLHEKQEWLARSKKLFATTLTEEQQQALELQAVGNLEDKPDWERLLANVEVVIHLASRVHVMDEQAPDPTYAFRQVNVEGTRYLAEAALQSGVKRFIFLSTIKVLGEGDNGKPFTERDRPAPKDAYSQVKWEAEQMLATLTARHPMDIVIVRPPLIYGQGVKGNFLRLLGLADSNWWLPLAGVYNRRSLLSLENLVDFIQQCLNHPDAANQTFLLADGEDFSVASLLRKMRKKLQRRNRLLYVPQFLLAVLLMGCRKKPLYQRVCGSLRVSGQKAREQLGWQPMVSLDDGLARTLDWYSRRD